MQVKSHFKAEAENLTANERKFAAALLSDYSYAGLVSILQLAARAEVSAPSFSRLVTKIAEESIDQTRARVQAWDAVRLTDEDHST